MEEKFEFIEDFLTRCEDWMHGEDGENVTKAKKYLLEVQEQIKNNTVCPKCGKPTICYACFDDGIEPLPKKW